MLGSCVVGRRKQYGGHHESDLRGCRAVVQRSWFDSSPVKFLEVSLVRVWPRRLVKAMFSLNCFAIRKVLLISGPLPSRVSDHDVVSPSLLQCAFCGHYRHISCIFKTFVRSRWCWLMVICPAETEFVAITTDLCPPNIILKDLKPQFTTTWNLHSIVLEWRKSKFMNWRKTR